MKTITRNLIVAVVLMLGTLTNYANVEGISKKFKVVFENVEKGHALTVKDHSGTILHKEDILKDGELVKYFDFSSLENGVYAIEVEKEYEILLKEIEIKNGIVTLKKDSEKVIFRPILSKKDNKILVSRINFDKSPLNVSIYYKDYLILEETISSSEDKIINKVYGVDEALKGEYKIFVSSTESSASKQFEF